MQERFVQTGCGPLYCLSRGAIRYGRSSPFLHDLDIASFAGVPRAKAVACARWQPRTASGANRFDRFATLKPGAILDRAGSRCARHINVWIVARGASMSRSIPGSTSPPTEEAAKTADSVLRLIEQPVRRSILLANRAARPPHGWSYSFTPQSAGPDASPALERQPPAES